MIDELQRYRQVFRTMLEQKSPTLIPNQSWRHAGVILQELIGSAKERVCIQCTHLDSSVYGTKEMLDCVENALGRGVDFIVNIRDEKIEATRLYDMLVNSGASCKVNKSTSVFDKDVCVVDSRAYRLETDETSKSAIVCACDQETGAIIDGWFSKKHTA